MTERFFAADLVALLERGPGDALAFHYCTLEAREERGRLLEEVRAAAGGVLDSGFLASELIALPDPHAIALLPLSRERQTSDALLIGHRSRQALSQAQLDLYLAVAGLFEGTLARLGSERAATENARRFEEQRRIAEALQRNLMSPLPQIPGLDLDVVMQTAHQPELVGGDFSDVFTLDGGARRRSRRRCRRQGDPCRRPHRAGAKHDQGVRDGRRLTGVRPAADEPAAAAARAPL